MPNPDGPEHDLLLGRRSRREELRSALPPEAAESLRRAYRTEVFPRIFQDPRSAEKLIAAVFAMDDLSDEQRAEVADIAAEYRPAYDTLSEKMVEVEEARAAQGRPGFDGDQEKMRKQLETMQEQRRLEKQLRFDRSDLSQRVRDQVRLVLTEAQRDRIERMLRSERRLPFADWKTRYLDHPLVGFLARRLIWWFDREDEARCAVWHDGRLVDLEDPGPAGQAVAGDSVAPVGPAEADRLGEGGGLFAAVLVEPFAGDLGVLAVDMVDPVDELLQEADRVDAHPDQVRRVVVDAHGRRRATLEEGAVALGGAAHAARSGPAFDRNAPVAFLQNRRQLAIAFHHAIEIFSARQRGVIRDHHRKKDRRPRFGAGLDECDGIRYGFFRFSSSADSMAR